MPITWVEPDDYEVSCSDPDCPWAEFHRSKADAAQALANHWRDWHDEDPARRRTQ